MSDSTKSYPPKNMEYFTNKYCQCGIPTTCYTDEIDGMTRCNICGKRLEGFD